MRSATRIVGAMALLSGTASFGVPAGAAPPVGGERVFVGYVFGRIEGIRYDLYTHLSHAFVVADADGNPRGTRNVPSRELTAAASPAEVVAAFRERNIRYLVLSAEFLDRYYNRRVCDWMFELSQREPEAVVFRTSLSRVLDLGRLPAR